MFTGSTSKTAEPLVYPVVCFASSLTILAYSPSIVGSSHATCESSPLCQPFSWGVASVGPTLGKIVFLTQNPVEPMEKCSPFLFGMADRVFIPTFTPPAWFFSMLLVLESHSAKTLQLLMKIPLHNFNLKRANYRYWRLKQPSMFVIWSIPAKARLLQSQK